MYGIPEELPCRETQRPAPQSPYGASKLAAEHYLHTLGQLHGIETVALRYFNVFGPGQDPASEYAAVVPRFVTAVLEGRTPTIYGSGEISRDFTYVDNVVAGNLLASIAPVASPITCNVACGSRYSLLELLQAICDAAGRQVAPRWARHATATSGTRRPTSRSRARHWATKSSFRSGRASREPSSGTAIRRAVAPNDRDKRHPGGRKTNAERTECGLLARPDGQVTVIGTSRRRSSQDP